MPQKSHPRRVRRVKHYLNAKDIEISGGNFEISAYRFHGVQHGPLTYPDTHEEEEVEITMLEGVVGAKISGGTFIAAGTSVHYDGKREGPRERQPSSQRDPAIILQVIETEALAATGARATRPMLALPNPPQRHNEGLQMHGMFYALPPAPQAVHNAPQHIPWQLRLNHESFGIALSRRMKPRPPPQYGGCS